MTKYKCPWCGNISDELVGYTDRTEYDEYSIDEFGELQWLCERGSYDSDIAFECQVCNETTDDWNLFTRVYDD